MKLSSRKDLFSTLSCAVSGVFVFFGSSAAGTARAAAQIASNASAPANTFPVSTATILNVVSIAIVAIVVLLAVYRIASKRKGFADVAPLLIGGFLLGAFAQIAKQLVG